MEISREIIINGESQNTKYALTGIEMERTYNEVQDVKIADLLSAVLDDKEYENAEEIPKELIDEMKQKFRKEIGDLMKMTMENVVEGFADRLEEYKEKWKVFSKQVTLTMTHDYTIKAKNKEDADRIFDAWTETRRGMDTLESDLTEDVSFNGEWDYGYSYEDDCTEPDYADISEEDI